MKEVEETKNTNLNTVLTMNWTLGFMLNQISSAQVNTDY